MTKKKANPKASPNNILPLNNNKIRLGWHLIECATRKKRLDYLKWGLAMLVAGVCELAKEVFHGKP